MPTALRISTGIATRRLLPTSITLTWNSIGKAVVDSQGLHLKGYSMAMIYRSTTLSKERAKADEGEAQEEVVDEHRG